MIPASTSPSSSSLGSSSSSSSSSPPSSSECNPGPPGLDFLRPEKSYRIINPPGYEDAIQNKRKRDLLDTGTKRGYPTGKTNQFRVAVREPLIEASPGSSFGPSGKLKAKPPKPYNTSEELLAALAHTCLRDPEVDFSGSYHVSGSDADTTSDKQRVQNVAHAIWKATGYRFTVKDHPPTERGHKTRLWCSQDEARRSKHRGPGESPRVSKQGELFAKPRFPCRSRLMIACVPEGAPSDTTAQGQPERRGQPRLVTVRMHHYMRHESYLEGEAAVVAAPAPLLTTQFLSAITAPLPPHLRAARVHPGPSVAPPPALHEQEGEWEASSHPHPHPHQQHAQPEPEPAPSPSPSPHFAPAQVSDPHLSAHHPHLLAQPNHPPPPHSQAHAHAPPPYTTHTQITHAPPHPPPQAPQIPPHPPPPPQITHSPHPPHPPPHAPITRAEFEHRMRTHIARIRDFCDGLEFQVQFGDVRMLEALERDAAPFLGLLDGCLRQEGR